MLPNVGPICIIKSVGQTPHGTQSRKDTTLTTETETAPSLILTNAAKEVLSKALAGLASTAKRAEAIADSDENYRYATAFGAASAGLSAARTDIVHALKLLGVDLPWPNEIV